MNRNLRIAACAEIWPKSRGDAHHLISSPSWHSQTRWLIIIFPIQELHFLSDLRRKSWRPNHILNRCTDDPSGIAASIILESLFLNDYTMLFEIRLKLISQRSFQGCIMTGIAPAKAPSSRMMRNDPIFACQVKLLDLTWIESNFLNLRRNVRIFFQSSIPSEAHAIFFKKLKLKQNITWFDFVTSWIFEYCSPKCCFLKWCIFSGFNLCS